jgi:hypothetical protein
VVSCSFAACKTPEFDRRAIVYRPMNANAVAPHFPIYCSYVAIYFAYDGFIDQSGTAAVGNIGPIGRSFRKRPTYAYSMVYLRVCATKLRAQPKEAAAARIGEEP